MEKIIQFNIAITSLGKRELVYMILVHMNQLMRFWYLSHKRPLKAQASLRICSLTEPSLFTHMKVDKGPTTNQTSSPRVWRMILRRTESTIISWDGSFVYLPCMRYLLSFFASFWCQRFIPACDSGTPWTFYLAFCIYVSYVQSSIVVTLLEEQRAGRFAGCLLVSTFCGFTFSTHPLGTRQWLNT